MKLLVESNCCLLFLYCIVCFLMKFVYWIIFDFELFFLYIEMSKLLKKVIYRLIGIYLCKVIFFFILLGLFFIIFMDDDFQLVQRIFLFLVIVMLFGIFFVFECIVFVSLFLLLKQFMLEVFLFIQMFLFFMIVILLSFFSFVINVVISFFLFRNFLIFGCFFFSVYFCLFNVLENCVKKLKMLCIFFVFIDLVLNVGNVIWILGGSCLNFFILDLYIIIFIILFDCLIFYK